MKFRIIILLLIAAGLAFLIVLPYMSANRMVVALRDQDSQGLSECVDFPVLQDNLKRRVSASLDTLATKHLDQDRPLAALGIAFGEFIWEKLVDRMVSPVGLADLMNNGERAVESECPKVEISKDSPDYTMGYESWNRFAVTFLDDESETIATFILAPAGLSWKLIDIRL